MPSRRRAGDRDVVDGVTVTHGSGNVFADLGLPNAEERSAKAELARAISVLLEGMTQAEAAALLGVDQPKVSALLRGKLKDFSTDRLLSFLTRLGRDVEIHVKRRRRTRGAGGETGRLRVVAEAG